MTDTPMTEADVRQQMHLALTMEIHHLPQIKGKGAIKDRQRIETAVRILANYLCDHLLLSNVKFYRGPPAEPHTGPYYMKPKSGATND